MLIGHRAPHAPPRRPRWLHPDGRSVGRGDACHAGFGATGAAPLLLLHDASRRACRRRMVRHLRQQRDLVAISAAGRRAFDGALADLDRLAAGAAWCYRVRADGLDLTFWIGAGPPG